MVRTTDAKLEAALAQLMQQLSQGITVVTAPARAVDNDQRTVTLTTDASKFEYDFMQRLAGPARTVRVVTTVPANLFYRAEYDQQDTERQWFEGLAPGVAVTLENLAVTKIRIEPSVLPVTITLFAERP